MAKRLLTTRLSLVYPVRHAEIVSGEAGADEPYGFRGWSTQANHGYAHLVRTLGAARRYDGGVLFDTTDTVAGEQATGWQPIEIGAHIASLRLVADLEDGFLKLLTTAGDSAYSAEQVGRGIVTVTLAPSSTGIHRAHVNIKASAAQTCELRGWILQEVPLVVGDLP